MFSLNCKVFEQQSIQKNRGLNTMKSLRQTFHLLEPASAMMFGQLSNRESLRDLIVALEAHQAKCYHLGLGREPLAKPHLHQLTKIGITESLKILHSS